ncbi:hypothetical protein [Mycobacterium sp. URHB0021]
MPRWTSSKSRARASVPGSMWNTVFHDSRDGPLILQDGDVLQRIAVDEDHVGEKACFDVAEFVRQAAGSLIG